MFELKIRTKKYNNIIKDLVQYHDECKEYDVIWSCKGKEWGDFFNNLFDNNKIIFDYHFFVIQEVSSIILYDDEFVNRLVDKESVFKLPQETIDRLKRFNNEVDKINIDILIKLFNTRSNAFKFFALGDMTYYLLDVVSHDEDYDIELEVKDNG